MAYIYDPDNKFGYKDELPITCDEKVIRGTDFDAEFLRIQAGVGDSFDETNAGLQQEIEDRIAGDQNLQDQINNLDNSQIVGDLNAEIQARIEGDQNLQDQIDDLLAQPGAGMVIQETEPTEEERVPGLQWLDSTTAEVWIWDGERWLEFPAGSGGSGGDSYWSEADDGIKYDGTVNAYKFSAININSQSTTNSNNICTMSSGVISATGANPDDIIFYGSDSTRSTTSNISAKGGAWFKGGLTTDGDVGIGTDDPQRKFHSKATQQVGAVFEATGNRAYVGFLDVNRDDQGGQYGPLVGSSGNNFVIATGAGNSERVRVDVAGNVGIGTNDPQAKVSIVGERSKTNFEIYATTDRGMEINSYDAGGSADCGVEINSRGSNADGFNAELALSTGGEKRLVVNSAGNVGIGVDPTTGTFDLSAKEQLKEWKTKAKKASWPIVTDGAFEQEPTEDLVAQWIETRAAGDKLQVAGNISATGPITAGSIVDSENGVSIYHNGAVVARRADSAQTGVWRGYGAGQITSQIFSNGDAEFAGTINAEKLTIYNAQSNTTQATFGTLNTGFRGLEINTKAKNANGVWAQLNAPGADSAGTNSQISLATAGVDHLTINGANGNATFSGNIACTRVDAPVWRRTDKDFGLSLSTSSLQPVTLSGTEKPNAINLGSNTNRFNNAYFSGNIYKNGDASPLINGKDLISTLSTLRKATMDETKDIRESLRSAIDELVEGFEQQIAAMPAPEPEVSTMEIPE